MGLLAAHVIEEAGRQGFQQPYYEAMLGAPTVHPLCFDKAVAPCLRGARARQLFDIQRKAVRTDYVTLLKCWSSRPPAPFEFARVYAIVSQRANPQTFGASPVQTMTPLLDTLRCSASPNAYFVAEARGGVMVIALEDIPVGCPVRLGHGGVSNSELFVRYGNVLESNPDDVAPLVLPAIPPGHPLRAALEKSRAALNTAVSGPCTFMLHAKPSQEGLKKLLSYFRMMCLEDPFALLGALVNGTSGAAGATGTIRRVSRANELAALREFGLACVDNLERYEEKQKTIVEHVGVPVQILRNRARRVCEGETAILRSFINLAEQAMSRLQQSAPTVQAEVKAKAEAEAEAEVKESREEEALVYAEGEA